MHRIRTARTLLSAAAMLLAAAACAEKKPDLTAKMPGTWTQELKQGGQGGTIVQKTTLVLEAGGTYTMTNSVAMDGRQMAGGTDAGTWAVNDAILALNSPNQGVTRYTISGDTLFMRAAEKYAQTKAVTGTDLAAGDETFLVRQP